jgi:hypothetical protein
MRRLLAGATAAALTATLLLGAPGPAAAVPRAAAAVCPDPTQPIVDDLGIPGDDVVVGTTKTKTLELEVYTYDGCQVTGATATVKAPRKTTKVTLTKVGTDRGFVQWRGSLTIKPSALVNSDAGVWPVTYRVTGEHADSLVTAPHVRRASRISFNAGPEPVEKGIITYAGLLERANWSAGTYRPWPGRKVAITYWPVDPQDPHDPDFVGEPLTSSTGKYRLTEKYRGPGDYSADVGWTTYTAGTHSRTDVVSTPRG